jgi:hypothetical protein
LPANIEWVPDTLLDLFRADAPLAFSVGFRIKNARQPSKRDRARYGETVQRVITDWELLEFSVVPIPANQDALAVAVSKCAGRVGSFTRGALGLQQTTSTTTITPSLPRRLRYEGAAGVARLSMPTR